MVPTESILISIYLTPKVINSEHMLERLAWGSFILLGLILGFAATYNLWRQFANRDVNVKYTKYKQVDAIPFPTIR